MMLVFWTAVGVLVYTYAGYPLLVVLLGWCVRRTVHKGPLEPSVSVLIAARNEVAHIGATLRNKLALRYPASKLQIIVVSDASTDGTDEVVKQFEADGVVLLRQDVRHGKTAALNLAVERATGDVLVFSDANSLYEPDALRMLVRNFVDRHVGYVTGRLQYVSKGEGSVGIGCRLYMAYEHVLRGYETRLGSIAGVNGGIDAVRRSLYVAMRPDQLPDLVLPLSVIRRGYRVVYEPEAILREDTLASAAAEYRMRVRVSLRAWSALFDMRALFNPRHGGLFALQLASHKVLRYLAFAAVPVLYAVAFWTRGEGLPYQACFASMSAFFVLSAAGGILERFGRPISLMSVPYHFVLVNAAAAHALFNYLRGRRQAVWTPRLG